jgi:AcrR family transcriptional regulator
MTVNVQTAGAQATAQATVQATAQATEAVAGLRERKKQRTRLALIDAALDLFLAKGYERTTVDEIVARVNVSQRTFFRYFATKEDVIMSFIAEYDAVLTQVLAARPPEEPPRVALLRSLRRVLEAVEDSHDSDMERFRRLRQVTETTPALVSAQMAQYAATEKLLVAEIARRQGVDPAADLRPHLLVAFYMSAVRVGFEDCASKGIFEPLTVIRRVEESAALALAALKDGWDDPAA